MGDLILVNSEWNGTTTLEEIINGLLKLENRVQHIKIWYKLKLGYFENIFWNVGQQVSTLSLIENTTLKNESIYKIQKAIRNFRHNIQIARITVNLQSVPTLFTSLKWILHISM